MLSAIKVYKNALKTMILLPPMFYDFLVLVGK